MSNSNSFINEVSEEVRRDRFYGYLRRYGWLAILVVLLLVGAAAYNEWNKARETAAAQVRGDALLDALDIADVAERAQALSAVSEPGPVGQLLAAAELEAAGDLPAAAATLDALATDSGAPFIYRELASLKSLMVQADTLDAADRRNGLEALAEPGAPFRLLAREQIALMDLAAGESDVAIAGLQAIYEDAEATAGLRERARTVMVALGNDPEAPTDAPAADTSGN